MKRAKFAAKRKIVDIDRGLFLVRYASADDSRHPPSVKISFEPNARADNLLIIHPDARDAVLSEPGTALAVRAERPTKLLVEVTPTEEDGSTAATVKVEALNPGVPSVTTARTDVQQHNDSIRLRAHVAGIGDMVVSANEWIAGPTAPSRIEGIAIEWPDKPDALDLRYAVKFAGPEGAAGRMTGTGTFVGTRGRAIPVTGIVLELSGDDAGEHELIVEALFLGAPVTRTTGRRVVVSGPTSREPLVGLRLDVAPRDVDRAKFPVRDQKIRPGQVRVFRGRSKAAQAAL